MYKRDIVNTINHRLEEKRRFIQVIMGPRQVGKTTAIQQIIKEKTIPCHYAAADLPAPPDTEWISRQWDLARMKMEGRQKGILVLDEVQKIAHWSNEVKRLWDEDTRLGSNLHVVVLGSSSLLIQKGLEESLAGRFEIIRFPHWSWLECRDCFNWTLDKYIYFGGYPGAADLIEEEDRWSRYIRDSLIETAISKDILLLNRVEKPALLRQLFVLSCDYGGQILSYQKIMGQLTDSGNTTTLAHYQRLLESAFLIRGLPKWSGNLVRRRNSSPKWLPLNTALMSALANRSFKECRSAAESWGRLVEVSVGAHLVNSGISHGIDIYYWREGNKEVDFVIRKGNKITAIEVKSGRKRGSLPGISKFLTHYSTARSVVVGSQELSLREFLETPLSKWVE
ncbi:MAG: ATP-binding protein [Candidatus Omnitrophica bacterium]|nr:ATP-binding protein [Candidatus Omnitrophota bacterium]MBU4479519.1 ATP-binding protein [Candidatus Omnitrophota bacterium]